MITRDQILLYLHRDNWFEPSGSDKKAEIQDENGNTISVPLSYYHHYDDLGDLVIRVSDHGTYLQTWVEHEPNVAMNIQNLSVVFSNGPVEYKKETKPKYVRDENGNTIVKYVYFVVEQYVYRLDNLGYDDFLKVINQVKKLNADKVFSDPLKKKPSKRANRKPLTPNDINDNPIPPETNEVHPRQTVVKDNPDYEVDAKGNILKNESADYDTKSKQRCNESLNEQKLRNIIRRVIKEELNPTIPDAEYCISHQKFDKSCGQKNARTNCKYRRIGKYLIIKGDNQPHRIEGMEQYGKNLYDKAMYTAPDETICVFSVGEGTNKRICCRLEYDESTRMWLGFTPLEAKDVPVLIRQHIKDKSLNRW